MSEDADPRRLAVRFPGAASMLGWVDAAVFEIARPARTSPRRCPQQGHWLVQLRRGVLPICLLDRCISAHFSNDPDADHGSGSTCGDGDDKRQQYQEDRQFHPGQRDIRLSPNASRVRVGVLERRLRRGRSHRRSGRHIPRGLAGRVQVMAAPARSAQLTWVDHPTPIPPGTKTPAVATRRSRDARAVIATTCWRSDRHRHGRGPQQSSRRRPARRTCRRTLR